MTLTAIIWTVAVLGLCAFVASEYPKHKQLLTFIGASCLLWTAGVLVWLVVGRVMEVLG